MTHLLNPSAFQTTPSAGHVVAESEAEETMQRPNTQTPADAIGNESCLVQIYPADVIDGMLLLETDCLTIGREDECDLVLEDSSVSRRHVQLIQSPEGHSLQDLGSTNGTLVNGNVIEGTHVLQTGDILSIGSFIFKYLSAGSVESQYHETVYQSLTRDALTGAMNKRYLLESMQRELARSFRRCESLAVVMIDIDHFKGVNDTHGHLVGDEVLREFGARLLATSREDDLLARYGGEEFTLLMAGTDRDEAIETAERCRSVICSEPFATAVGPLEISASFGVALYDGKQMLTPAEVLKIADDRLYTAKRDGRNRVSG
ncbi:diguanylate cyclase (GGDEF) domain-containing protein [Neorhodopirellula lusitana]|uniref:diguanylate cyclase n=1 Tax=Neorhodopirellula lusitana TaxID=445327 RepID=A0ABY1QH77_9BACT|nr:GGDEF domain-containing protein [Neorhodopirellula lusitana]SMP70508.1 diguanylate cyclase (GGDEF) domain-containing protein [Neorhodopirellula lusitana]